MDAHAVHVRLPNTGTTPDSTRAHVSPRDNLSGQRRRGAAGAEDSDLGPAATLSLAAVQGAELAPAVVDRPPRHWGSPGRGALWVRSPSGAQSVSAAVRR